MLKVLLEKLELEAELVISLNDDHFVLVAEGNYLIVNFKDLKALERVAKTAGELGPKPGPGASNAPAERSSGGGGPLKKLNDLNDKIRESGLIVDIRVNNKTYVEFGSGSSAKITAAAIFGKIGSFFSRG